MKRFIFAAALAAALSGCQAGNNWHDFTDKGRGDADLRMDFAGCQQESAGAAQNNNDCSTKQCVGVQVLANVLAQAAAFNNCMTAHGWEQVTPAQAQQIQQAQKVAEVDLSQEDEDDDDDESAGSDAFTKGDDAMADGDYAGAMHWYMVSASKGNTKAQANVGALYESGLGVPKDNARALRWYRKAAQHGNVAAKKHLKELAHHHTGKQAEQ